MGHNTSYEVLVACGLGCRVIENVLVISVLGRYLEHCRIYYFHNNGVPPLFIGSTAWQRCNLEDRVEAILEVKDHALILRLIRTLQLFLSDRRSAWRLHSRMEGMSSG